MKFSTLLLAAAFGSLAAGVARADTALEVTGASPEVVISILPGGTVGWSFTTNQAITIDALDAFNMTDSTGDVRLYNAAGTTLASAIVTTSDPTDGSPIPFYSQAITPITLAAGEEYFIAEDIVPEETLFYLTLSDETPTVTTDPAITYDGGVAARTTGENPTTDEAFNEHYEPGFFGPNFDIAAVTLPSVPLPSAGLSGLTLMAGIGLWKFRRKNANAG